MIWKIEEFFICFNFIHFHISEFWRQILKNSILKYHIFLITHNRSFVTIAPSARLELCKPDVRGHWGRGLPPIILYFCLCLPPIFGYSIYLAPNGLGGVLSYENSKEQTEIREFRTSWRKSMSAQFSLWNTVLIRIWNNIFSNLWNFLKLLLGRETPESLQSNTPFGPNPTIEIPSPIYYPKICSTWALKRHERIYMHPWI